MATDQIHIEPAFEPLLAQHGLTNVASIMKCPARRPTSRHKTRSTAPITLENGEQSHEFYLKRVFRVPLKHVFGDLIRGHVPQAQPVREWRAIERLVEQEIGVMRPAACGQRRWFGLPRQAFLLVEAVPAQGPVPVLLARWMASSPTDRAAATCRHTMLVELGAFVRRLHDAHLAYPDLVGKHVYLKPAEGRTDAQRWEFFLIDVERLSSTTSAHVHRRELRHFLSSLKGIPLSATDLLRFAIGYAGRDQRSWPERKATLTQTFDWAGKLLNRRRNQAARRPRQPAAALRLLEERFISAGRITVNQRYASALQQHGLGDFRSVFKYDRVRRLEKARLAACRERLELALPVGDGYTQTLYLKRFTHPPLRQQLTRMITMRLWHGMARWEWRQIQALHRVGIPTMVPVAFGEKMRGCFERRSFLVTEAVPGHSLERWVPSNLEPVGTPDACAPAAAARRRDLITQVARVTATLHAAGYVHRDLYLSHVFVSFDSTGRVLLHLIDLSRVFKPRWRRTRWIVKDLAALDYSAPRRFVSLTDRVRFLRTYLQCDKLDSRGKALARRVAAKTRRMTRHNGPIVPVAGATSPS